MGFENLQVVLEPHQAVYFSGQTIQGYVRCHASEPVSCRRIKVIAYGKAEVEWSERRNKTTHYYTNHEMYMNEEKVVWRKSGGSDHHPRGLFKYPFSFLIPPNQPSSYEAYCGRVRYCVKAEADIPMWRDQTTKTIFSLNCIYDLNQHSLAMAPLEAQKEKEAKCCGVVRTGPISITVRAPKRGYVPGEKIVVNAEVTNNSGRTIEYTEAKLVQYIIFKSSEGRTKIHYETLERVYRPAIEQGETDDWKNVPLTVPSCTPSELKFCTCIDVQYKLVMQAKLGCCLNLELENEVLIGSVPLRNTYTSQANNRQGGTMLVTSVVRAPPSRISPRPSAPRRAGGLPRYCDVVLPEAYMDLPPPSYESCMLSKREGKNWRQNSVDNDDTDDEGEFVPNYLHYNFNNSPYNTTSYNTSN